MARPSLKDVRTVEILDAFAQCVANYGLDGSTLERISEVAGVKRPILRHYLGNREEMVAKLIDHVVDRFNDKIEGIFADLPEEGRWAALTDTLFHEEERSPVNAAIFAALVAASDRYPDIKAELLDFVIRLENTIAIEVVKEFPKADHARCQQVAAGITALYFNTDAIAPLGPPKSWLSTQKKAALLLTAGL